MSLLKFSKPKYVPYFVKPVGFTRNTGIFWEEDKIKIFFKESGIGIGGFGFKDNLVPDGFNEIDLKLTKFLGTKSGGTDDILSLKSTTSSYSDGRLIKLSHSPTSTAPLRVQLANSTTTWESVYYEQNVFPYNNLYEYKININKVDSTSYKFKVCVNDTILYEGNRALFNNGYWCPQFCLSEWWEGGYPTASGLHSEDYIVMSKSYLYIDDERIFGFR